MKQLFLKKLFSLCAIAALTTTGNVNATESINQTERVISVKKPTNDIPFFKGHRQGRGVTLQWVTNNIESMELQYSYDAEFWDTIDQLAPKNKARQNYNIEQVFPGYHHYRLKATTADGEIIYSDVATIRIVQRR